MTDEEKAAGWFRALDIEQTNATDLKRKPIVLARTMLFAMCKQPHAFAKAAPLPEAFPDLLAQHGIDQLEKAALRLGRMGAAIVKQSKGANKPMMFEFSLSPPGPML